MNQADLTARCLDAALSVILEKETELAHLDSVAGDGDHGAGMARGFRAVVASGAGSSTAGEVLAKAGMAFSNAAGGSSGALVGMYLMTLGMNLSGEITQAAQLHRALLKAQEAVMKLGKSQAGDKTLLDTLVPFTTAYGEAASAGATLTAAWLSALGAARTGMESTRDMISKRGRSAVLKERSLGTQDPGATSVYYVLQAVGDVLQSHCSH